MKYSISIIGLGGVGGYFGFKLAHLYSHSENVEINFIVRNETYKIIKENGLQIISPEFRSKTVFPTNLYDNLKDLPKSNLIIICVKDYDLVNVCTQINDCIDDSTIILPLMNGVDIYDRIRKIIPKGIIIPACVYVASHVVQKGVIMHKGKPGKIILGKDVLHIDFSVDFVIEIFKKAEIDVHFSENPFVEIWTKFLFIASFGLITARYNISIGEVNSVNIYKNEAKEIMAEIIKVAECKGILFSELHIEETFQTASTFPYNTPTSLQLDVQSRKNKTELELFAGTIIHYAKSFNIKVPMTTKIYIEIKQSLN